MKYSYKLRAKEIKYKKSTNGKNKIKKNSSKFYNWIFKYYRRNMKFCNSIIRIEFMKTITKQ